MNITRFTSKYKGNFLKFCLVGLSGAVIQIGLTRLFYFMFATVFHVSGSNANTFSVILAIPFTTVWNFVWNISWVFKR